MPKLEDSDVMEVISNIDTVKMKSVCWAVDSGEVSIEISPHLNGRFYIHFSGIGNKRVEVSQTSGNAVEVILV